MAAMKVTISAAMRARDVSRPHAEHLAFAEAAQASAASSRPAAPAVPSRVDAPSAADAPSRVDAPSAADAAGANAVPGDEILRDGVDGWPGEAAQAAAGREGERTGRRSVRSGGTRRRWRPRGSGRGRASSR